MPLTRREAAVIGAYTGINMDSFGEIQAYAEEALGRPIWTHEFANAEVWAEPKEASKADFLAICEAVIR